MWIFTNSAFISVVAHRDQPGFVLARARIAGDLERFFGPKVEEQETTAADYRFRAVVSTEGLAEALLMNAAEIGYDNFKNSIPKIDRDRHDAYMGVWHVMNRYQHSLHPARPYGFPQAPLFDDSIGSINREAPEDGSIDAMPDDEYSARYLDTTWWCEYCGTDITAEVYHDVKTCPYCGESI